MGTRMKKIVVGALVGLAVSVTNGWAETSAERRLRVLEETVQQLRRELEQQKAIGSATQKQTEAVEEKAKAVETAQKSGGDLPGWVKKVSLFGDVRLRHEGFYHQQRKDGDQIGARNRERFRARVGAKFTYSDELSAVIRLASGDPDDPISANQSLGASFNKKQVAIDQAYITFTPGKSFDIRPGAVSITGGKFPNPLFRVGEMVFDEDLMGEGLSESFALLGQPVGALDQLKIHMLQWVFSEFSNAEDGWMIGGQVNPQAHVGDWQFEGGIGQYWWLNPDHVAQNLNANKALKNSNVLEIQDDKVVGFASAFNQTNLTFAATHPTLIYGKPLKLFADYVYNWEAFNDDGHGVQAGVKVGQAKAKGDWAVTGMYEYLGQEAALSPFTYSDFGFGLTNVQGPVLGVEYQLLDPLTISAKNHFTNLINTSPTYRNQTMFRLQLDAIVRF